MDATRSGHACEGADREGGQPAYRRGDSREDRTGGRNSIQACEVLDDGDAGSQQDCVGRSLPSSRVIDVDRVNPDQGGAEVDERACTGFGEVGMDGITVPVGAPVPIPTSPQQHCCSFDLHVGERAGTDGSVAAVHDYCTEQGAAFERKARQVVAVAEAVGSGPGIQGRVRASPDRPGFSRGAQLSVTEHPEHRPEGSAPTMNGIHQSFAQQSLVRPREGRVLGGVCAGLGRRFGIAPWTARLLFLMLLMVIPGSQLLIYPILWILMPSEGTVSVQG